MRCLAVSLALAVLHLASCKGDASSRLVGNDRPILELSVHPTAGSSTDNIEVRCQISHPLAVSPLSSSKLENVFLAVKTDNVKPSGIFLMFDDSSDRCRINRENVRVDVCNASLLLVHINHTILNETLHKIDYSCSKGNTYAYGSYRLMSECLAFICTTHGSFEFCFHYALTEDQSARYFDPTYSVSAALGPSPTLLVLVGVVSLLVPWRTASVRR